MGTMKTAEDPKNYQPTTLIAPDGREFTPGSVREHNEVVGLGYRPAPTPPADDDPAPTQTQDPAESAPAAEQLPADTSRDEAQAETPTPADTADASTTAETSTGDTQSGTPAPAETTDVSANPAPASLAAPRRKAGGK